ncbi:MAG: DUF488 domain-containing protein [Rhodospirillales bacterium]|nr:DUF488 domain-containing protein [Rhodospirillales bacterium]
MTAEGEKAARLCTIGYERAALAGFVAALKAASVATLVDVRDRPWSQRPEFRRDALRKSLLAAGIGYVHIRALGNPKEGRPAAKAAQTKNRAPDPPPDQMFLAPARPAAKAGDAETYRRHMDRRLASGEGQEGLGRAAELAGSGPICLMCYERDPADCHRSLVADDLVRRGLGQPRHLFVE